MHPVGLYLATKDFDREHGRAHVRRSPFARVDAMPILEVEHGSRLGRLVAIVRRRVLRMAGA